MIARVCAGVLIACVPKQQVAAVPLMESPRQPEGVPLQACRVLVPEGSTLRQAISDLVRSLRERGATVTVVSPAEALDESGLRLRTQEHLLGNEQRETLILIGNIVTNRALMPLYAAILDFTDAHYPGGDGYVVRTVLDAPTRGTDCLVLGGSSEAGAVKAVRHCREIIAGLKPGQLFPRTLEAELGGDAAANLRGIGVPNSPTYSGYLYGLTGEERFVRAARQGFLLAPDTPGHASFYDVGDYGLEPLFRSWALVCDSSVFSAAEVQAVHQSLLNTLLHYQNEYWRARGGGSIGSRHQTMGTSAFLSVVRFLLRRGSPNAEAAALLNRWRSECEAYFANAVTTFHDDMEGIPSYHSVQPIVDYALEAGVADYFKRPTGLAPLEQAVLRAYASVDNLGYYCGTGTYEEARPGTVKTGIMLGYPLAIAACVNGDAKAAWLLRHFQGTGVGTWGLISGYGAHTFDVDDAVPEVEPRDLLGVVRAPLGEYRYSRLPHARDENQPGRMYLPTPYERTFEKLCFRDTFDPGGQYLVLEGYQGTGADNAPPLDANSIIRYTDRGVVWLIANTDRQGNFNRNSVFVSDGETTTPGWAGCELVGQASAGGVHVVVSKLGDYGSGEWTRSILWLKGKAFALIDSVRFDKPGERQAFCTFRSAPSAELHGREWIARSGTAELHLLNPDGIPMTSRRDGPEGAAIPTVLREVRTLKAPADTLTCFRNLFYVSTPERPQRFEIRPVGNSAVLILDAGRSDGCPGLFAVRGTETQLKVGAFESGGVAIYVGPDGCCAVDGSGVTLDGKALPVADGKHLAPGLRQALVRMWRQHRQPAQSATRNPQSTIHPAWKFTDLGPRCPAILSPVVAASELPTSGSLDDLVDGFIPLWFGDASWQNPKGAILTFDLRRSEDLGDVELATALVSAPNTLRTADKMPKAWPVTVEFSDDGFRKDVRGGPTSFQSGFTIEPLHKGTVFAMGRWRLSEVKQRARYVRLTFPTGPVVLREVFIRRATGTEARFGPSLVADLDGDGNEEIVITADTGELAVLGSGGVKRWGRKFAGPVTCLKAGALVKGGPTVLLVGTWEARVYCFSAQGQQQWVTDFLSLGGDLPVPFSIALTGPGVDEKRTVIVGNYARVSFVSSDGQLLSHSFAHGAFETMSLTDGLDLTGDEVEDALLYNVWSSLSVVDGAKRSVVRYLSCPRGEGLVLQKWGDTVPGEPSVLVASDNGVGLLRPASGRYDWQKGLTPLSCVASGDVDGDGQQEIVIGKRDGWLLVLSANGEVKRRAMVGDEVRAVVTLRSWPRRLWVATGTNLRVFDEKLTTVATFSCAVQRIEALGKDTILMLAEDGTVSAFRPSGHEVRQ